MALLCYQVSLDVELTPSNLMPMCIHDGHLACLQIDACSKRASERGVCVCVCVNRHFGVMHAQGLWRRSAGLQPRESQVIYGWIPPPPRGRLCARVASQLIVSLHFIVNLGWNPFPRRHRTRPARQSTLVHPADPNHTQPLPRRNPLFVSNPDPCAHARTFTNKSPLAIALPPPAALSTTAHPNIRGCWAVRASIRSFGCIK